MREAVLKSKNPREILQEIEEIEKMGEIGGVFLVYVPVLLDVMHENP